MKKYRVAKKEIRQNNVIIGVGFCHLQNLLNYENAFAYSDRPEGWSCDYYNIDNVIISTGYSPLKNKNASINYDMLKKYDNKALDITCDYSIPYEKSVLKVKRLLKKFIKEAIQ